MHLLPHGHCEPIPCEAISVSVKAMFFTTEENEDAEKTLDKGEPTPSFRKARLRDCPESSRILIKSDQSFHHRVHPSTKLRAGGTGSTQEEIVSEYRGVGEKHEPLLS